MRDVPDLIREVLEPEAKTFRKGRALRLGSGLQTSEDHFQLRPRGGMPMVFVKSISLFY